MLLKRIIPCLDVDKGRVVKGTNFVDIRDAGDPVELAARYDKEGADEVVFLDITASHEKRDTIVELARHCAEELFIPFTIGGGIRSEDDVRALLGGGRGQGVAQLRGHRRSRALVAACARRFGSQCVVIAIDAQARGFARPAARWEAYVNGGRTPPVSMPSSGRARVVARGAGEITAHLHGPRRHQGRLRPGAHPGGGGSGQRAGHRQRRRGHPRASGGGHPRRQG